LKFDIRAGVYSRALPLFTKEQTNIFNEISSEKSLEKFIKRKSFIRSAYDGKANMGSVDSVKSSPLLMNPFFHPLPLN
jgi:hypothetical protein